eukprot:TRINITY_DN43215_c0_g1_i1.p1 TRINITY_DN43215_c0_g1~~TRINITY_DN43215_c0_g1_i1.p1  ORF type:complete len:421 (-),score=44.70 TRINITY_DN43215_c0_g1_i1:29-1234(-)
MLDETHRSMLGHVRPVRLLSLLASSQIVSGAGDGDVNLGVWRSDHVPTFSDGDMTADLFEQHVLNGSAFIVRGAAKRSGMYNWSCDSIRSDPTFHGAEARLSYGQAGNDNLSSHWESDVRPTGARELDSEAPSNGALYFGIKDIQFADAHSPASWTFDMLQSIRKLTYLPAYMDALNLNRINDEGLSELDSFYSSPEIWLSPPSSGAQAHMDHHTSSTVSFQLYGEKQWRLSQIPPRETVSDRSEFEDGAIYRRKEPWHPQYVLKLQAGDALFFPPGTIHETSNTGTECAVSITYQFSVPMPSRYYRWFVKRFRRSADMHESWELMDHWAHLNGAWPSQITHNLTLQQILELAPVDVSHTELHDAFWFVDKDGDGIVALQDLRACTDELLAAAGQTQRREL